MVTPLNTRRQISDSFTTPLLNLVPKEHEKHLKQAFYNTGAALFIISVCSAAYAVYLILEVFVRPLLWAVLLGTFLYPFKSSLTCNARLWLRQQVESSTPFVFAIFLLPLQIIDTASETITRTLINQWKKIIGVVFCVLLVWVAYHFGPFTVILSASDQVAAVMHIFLHYCDATWVYTLALCYLITILFFWSPKPNKTLRVMGTPIWIAIFGHLVTLAGQWQMYVLLLAVVLGAIGFYTVMFDKTQSQNNVENEQGTVSKSKKQRKLSDRCFLLLFWFILIVRLWIHIWALPIVLLPILFVAGKKVLFSLSDAFWPRMFIAVCTEKWLVVKLYLSDRGDILVPRPIRGLLRLFMKGDNKILQLLERSLDKLTSVSLIVAVIIGTGVITVLLALQVHQESMHLVRVTGSLMNESVHQFPAIHEWLPEGDEVEKHIGDAYHFGRQWIASMINKALKGTDVDAGKIEQQILELWDQMYDAWVVKMLRIESGYMQSVTKGWSAALALQPTAMLFSLWNDDKNTTQDAALKNRVWSSISWSFSLFSWDDIVLFVKDNMEILLQILNYICTILQSNFGLAFSAFKAILRLVFGGGSAVLNFGLSIIIFITTLFILLSSSHSVYKPVEWFERLTPMGTDYKNKLGTAVEEAISGVFMASLKMSAFYGLFTWHTHLLFDVQMIFIPSALAAMLATVPFVGPYWAMLPGVLELYLYGDSAKAIALAAVHILPQFVVDNAIYSDIKGGGHPYLTGLAIAGGAFWLGVEGAIVAPIILCCLIVAVNIYTLMLTDEESGGALVNGVLPQGNDVPKTGIGS